MLSICLALLENPQDNRRFEEFYNKFNGMIYMIAKEHFPNPNTAKSTKNGRKSISIKCVMVITIVSQQGQSGLW